jgi:DNA-binding CsgD family transcriptional regulator/predicted negative regulator of RcsB-dependent stress response
MAVAFTKPIICPILIGRTPMLTNLHSLIDQVRGGQGQVVLLCGEAGIGKSRLVTESKTYAATQGFLLLQGQCFPTDRSCPYAPLLDLLRSHLATSSREQMDTEMGSLASVLSPLFPDLFPLPSDLPSLPPLDPEQEKRRLFAALAHLFLGQATKQPALLIVEDLHWSDETSLECLHYLARRCTASPLLVLLTYRSDEVHPSLSHFLAHLDRERLAQEFVLAPLTRSDTSAMLHAIFDLRRSVFIIPSLVQGDLLDVMYTLTEGNPFFIEELLKSLIETGDIFYDQGRWKRRELRELHIPRSVQDAVQLRTAHLSEPARQVLNLVAVTGRHFDFALLQELTQHDEAQLLPLIKELIAAQLVVEESAQQFAFRHALTREAIYAELLARERKVLHGTIAETLERLYTAAYDAHVAELAYHFYEADTWTKALEYAHHAGEKAQGLYSSRAAIEHFTRALDAAHHLGRPASPQVYHARGQAYETLGDFEHARRDYEQALDAAHTAQDGVAEWQSLIDLGSLWAARDYTQTSAFYLRAFEHAREMDQPLMLARSLNRVGNWHMNVGEPLEALQCHQEALAIFQQLHDPRGIAETLDLLGVASLLSGDLMQSAVYNQQAIVLLRELDERQRLISSLMTLMLCGGHYQNDTAVPAALGFAELLQHGEMALKIAGEIGSRSDEAYALIHIGMFLGPRGEYARALEVAQRGLAIAEEIEHRQWMTAGHRTLGALYLDLLALSEARQHLEQALALAQEIGSRFWARIASGFLALVSLAQHDVTRAESLLNSALGPDDPAQTVGQRLVWYARAELALARNDPQLALHITDQLLASAANMSEERVIPRLWKLRGEALVALHREAEAEKMLRAAQDAAHAQGLQPWLWRIAIDLGKLYQAELRDEEAALAFATAQELIEELAASIPDPPLRDHFLHQASALIPGQEPLSPRRAAKKAFGGLTEREREVAALIAQGKASREIAEILVVNTRTIEKHVENVLSKLGFTSRAQIAVWASEKGLGQKEQSQL